ncbi:MAG TPA: HEAT repeat domain-containing protein, partial [Planctomycetota bacterium]|nr:HEAT repeat domain-containing protein [Planctomycetota bacterium]
YRAIAELRARPPADVVAALVRRLRAAAEPSPKVRHYAVILLGHLGDPAAAPALRARLEDPIAEVRCNAALSLLRLGDRSGERVLTAELASPSRAVRSLAAAHLAWFGDRAGAGVLVDDLASPDPYVRASAIQALARLFGEDLGFAADAPEDARAAALTRWRARVK